MAMPFDYKIELNAPCMSDYFVSLGSVSGVGRMYAVDGHLDELGIALYYNASSPTSSAVYINSNKQLPTWLASNPVTVYYVLATPTTTEITNSELVGQLEAILQAYLYTGTNNVSNNAVSPSLAGQMNIEYKLIFSEETVLIEPTAVRLTLTDGGIINVCGCRQNVQLTMRETIQ